MNNFTASTTPEQNGEVKSVPRHLQSLTTTVFQSLFPPISPQSTPLTSIRRVLLLNREPVVSEDDPSYTIHLRHYAITTKSTGLSRPIRRLNAAERLIQSRKSRKGGLPNLHQMDDIADYMVGGDGSGYVTDATSGSEVDTDAEVEVMETRVKKIAGKRQRQQGQSRKDGGIGVQKKAVKLVELGPRMKLRLVKVEEGVCAGKVMWHEFISKSREEEQKMERLWETRTAEKEERRRIQRQNVERKKAKRGDAKGDDEAQGEGDGEGEGEEESEMDIDEWDDDLGEESEMDVEE